MTALRSQLFVAALAGLAAGAAMILLQLYATVPLILEAETLEHAVAGHDHAAAAGGTRLVLTAAANLVGAIGFALLLVAASEFAGGIRGWRAGLVWGLAGFATFTLAPGLGLPPELPGMPAAEIGSRQAWWIACAATTGAGLALIAFARGPGLGIAGALLLLLPHLVGAPQPPAIESPVPQALHQSFVVAVTVTSLAFWLILGLAVGAIRPRFAADLDAGRPRLA